MDLGLNGRTALVLGASSGLGRAIALALAREGAKVALAARRLALLEETAAAISGEGGAAMALEWDLSRLADIDGHVGAVEGRLGPIDILVNNTGGPPPTPAAGQAAELWVQQFNTLVLSLIKTTDRVLPGMRARRFGRIITSTPSGVVAPIQNLALSNSLRGALAGWSKTLAREVAADGVTVNLVLPGRIDTDRLKALDEARAKREGRPVEEVLRAATASIPVGRVGTPEEYADVVTFLASARASYVTGSMVRVDGGLIAGL